jgi:hypothetical protein
VKEYELGRACNMHGKKRSAYIFLARKKKEDLDVSGKIMLGFIVEN